MKKIIIAFLLFTGTLLTAKAQQYYPLLDSANAWHYTANYFPVRLQSMTNCNYPMYFDNGEGQYTGGDTIINSTTYKIMYAGGVMNSTCLFGFIREDTAAKKVYFMDNTGAPEILLYDFSMQVGDSININFLSLGGYYSSGTYTLDSIRTVNIAAGPRRKFFLNCHALSSSNTLTWIESVGSQSDVVYPYSTNTLNFGMFSLSCSGQPYDQYQFLICYEHNNYRPYYDSCGLYTATTNGCILLTDTCHYGNTCSAIKENNMLSDITVQPNPAADEITVNIELNTSADVDFYVWDIYGRRIVLINERYSLAPGHNEKLLDVSSLCSGIYMLECRTTSGSLFRKIIVQE